MKVGLKRKLFEDLEPLEMRPFEYDLIKGLKISEQIAYKKKYFQEKTEVDQENLRRLLLREKMKSNDSNKMNQLI